MAARARIYDAGFGLLYDVELEDGRAFSRQTPDDVRTLVRELRLVPWPDDAEPAIDIPERTLDRSGGWFVY